MNAPDCPTDAEWLAWLQDPCDEQHLPLFATHIESCNQCQARLEQLDEQTQRHWASLDHALLADLRCQPSENAQEEEPECIRATERVETLLVASLHHEDAPLAEVADLAALTQRGHYEILEVLGQGGMGVVYKARNLKLNRVVAIKVLPPQKSQSPEAVARFAREMKAIASLIHPNIVSAFDADEAEGNHFLVMEFLDGVDLKTLVKEKGPLPVKKAIFYIAQAARGLHHAHGQGIIHRDVKPGNLMLDGTGTVKVLDLGLARFETRTEAQADLTETGIMIGTVDFLAPEQAENTHDTDRRVDIYGLGCSLFYLLTGKTLYEGGSVLQKVLAHREKPIPSLMEACPGASASLEKVFTKMVAKRPADRYRTMAEVISDLENPCTDCHTTTLQPPPRAPWRRNWASWGAVSLVSLTLVVLASYWIFTNLIISNTQTVRTPLTTGSFAGEEWEGNDLGIVFCWCPAGRFLMSSPQAEPGRTRFESPQVTVVLSQGFWLGKYEVTQAEWELVTGTHPSRFQGSRTLPAENMAWQEAVNFCERLTQTQRQRGLLPGAWEYRLPTEAQWEYACRGGTTTAYSFGDSPEPLSDYAWHGENAEIRTHEVGQKKPNPWGFHDMHGNAWEWCRDWYHVLLPGGTDPEVKEPGTGRVIRGGGWNASANLCRTAFRSGQKPEEGGHLLGFRVALIQLPILP